MPWIRWFQQLYLRVGGNSAVSNSQVSRSAVQTLYYHNAPTALTAVFTPPPGQNSLISSFTLSNSDVGIRSADVYVLPFGVSPNDPNKDQYLVGHYDLQAKSSVTVAALTNFVLPSGYSIACQASGPDTVLVDVKGIYVS